MIMTLRAASSLVFPLYTLRTFIPYVGAGQLIARPALYVHEKKDWLL